jgi:hypothetical protein
MLNHGQTARKIRAMFNNCHEQLKWVNEAEVPAALRGRTNSMRYPMPLAHVICDSNKSRAMIGFLTQNNFEPAKIPDPDTWFQPADFYNDSVRLTQADILDGSGIVSVFIRFESGHSNDIQIEYTPFKPDLYPNRYLVHGTNEKNLSSILQRGLLPGGTRGGRNHVHFALDCCLTTIVDALRPESDCVIIARPTCLHGE